MENMSYANKAVGNWIYVDITKPEYPKINTLVLCYSCECGASRVTLGKFMGDYWDLGTHKRPLDGDKRVTYWAAFNPPPPFQMGVEGKIKYEMKVD